MANNCSPEGDKVQRNITDALSKCDDEMLCLIAGLLIPYGYIEDDNVKILRGRLCNNDAVEVLGMEVAADIVFSLYDVDGLTVRDTCELILPHHPRLQEFNRLIRMQEAMHNINIIKGGE